ncbi:DUF58 domain-containing protein [Paenibacillus sp. URB8-2]|uniref:DUF58 domain-containing protein n=1 Tax=Paenibacillus sp. URB8-2 TaxID=2741301 RepID=UPI0015BE5A93|nr:DUF58 domain-containing protein [Paenibacillus sp. URB8-2]BCG58178.1 hypothetical protein PUR_16030 [Paenibacillus sp. URB8-2]
MRRYLSAAAVRLPAKLAGIFAVWCVTLLYVLFQGGKTSFMLFTMVSVLLAYLLAGGFAGVRRARGARTLSGDGDKLDVLHAGGHLRVKLEIALPGFLPLPFIIVREMLKRHNGESWVFEESVVPNFRGRGELKFQTPPLERGRYTFSDTEVASEDIFGLVEHRGTFLAQGQFRVLPRIVHIPRWMLYERNSRLSGPQASLSPSRRETTQINGVRDYVYGDRMSRIHWNATAKTGAWKSKEFEHESLPKTMLILDGTSSAYSSSAQFELAVSTVASLLGYGIRERIGIGMCCLDRNTKVFAPAESGTERQKMVQYLIDINGEGKGPLVPRLEKSSRMFPKGAYFVLISPQTGENVLRTLRWAEGMGMTPCHIQVQNPPGMRRGDWQDELQSHGVIGYKVSALHELPGALGGN